MRPQLWMDSETGGLDYNVHSPLEFAFLAVKEGKIIGQLEISLRVDPMIVTRDALKTNKLNLSEIKDNHHMTYSSAKNAYYSWMNAMFYDHGKVRPCKENMPNFCGHNTFFDRPWLQRVLGTTFDMCYYHRIDTMVLGEVMREMGLIQGAENLQLGTLCEYFTVEKPEGDYHTALVDIKQTYLLYQKMKEVLKSNA